MMLGLTMMAFMPSRLVFGAKERRLTKVFGEFLLEAYTDPTNHRDSLAVADCLIAGAVGTCAGWLAAPGD